MNCFEHNDSLYIYKNKIRNNVRRGQNVEDKREISRVQYNSKGVLVVCETGETYYIRTDNVSPLGMGIYMDADSPDIQGKDIIVVTETLLMYADVTRQVKNEEGNYLIGIAAKNFTPEVLSYLFQHIGTN